MPFTLTEMPKHSVQHIAYEVEGGIIHYFSAFNGAQTCCAFVPKEDTRAAPVNLSGELSRIFTGLTNLEHKMAQIDDDIGVINASLDALGEDMTAQLTGISTDLQTLIAAPTTSAEQHTALVAISERINTLKATFDTTVAALPKAALATSPTAEPQSPSPAA